MKTNIEKLNNLAEKTRNLYRRLTGAAAPTQTTTPVIIYDTVTGLPNRESFQSKFSRQLSLKGKTGAPAQGTLFFIDILDIRKINERFGHKTTDHLIGTISDLLAKAIDYDKSRSFESDFDPIFARFGGTELVLYVPGMDDNDEIFALAAKCHAAMSNIVEASGRQFHPSIAIGIAKFPEHTTSMAEITQYAALACNTVAGEFIKEKTSIFETKMLQIIEDREEIEKYLRTAISEKHFEVYYQPKVSAINWSITGVEALVRLNHPERGVIGPNEFIPIAEITGLIFDIGLFVLEESIRQCAKWAQAGKPTEVSINVSVEQFKKHDFAKTMIELIKQYDCPTELVTIEITETIATSNIHDMAEHISTVRDTGALIAIDDFGTGYSNLVQLTKLKFDILKVDRSFINGIEHDGKARELSRAIINLGKIINCRVVVEGTETSDQVAAAAQLGCDEIQGYYFSKPMRCTDFEAWRDLRLKNPDAAKLEFATKPDIIQKQAS